ncbi:EamA family transporter, partial [Salmonella enterica]
GHHTSAVNISIMQGSIPILVLIGALVFFGVRATWLQIVGVVVTLGGVAMTATHGDITTITQLSFNIGDVWMLIA